MSSITVSAIFCGVLMFFGLYVIEAVRFVKEYNEEATKGSSDKMFYID